MEPDLQQLMALLPNLTAQLRSALSTLHLAAAQLAPTAAREQNAALDAQAAFLDQSYYQLLRLVANLTSVSNAFSETPLCLRDVDLVALLRTLCAKAESLAETLELKLQFVCSMEQHFCAADPAALEQLLYQLLSNAFKATPAGGSVTVELRLTRDWVLLSVTDTGRGIPKACLPLLFDRYLRSDPPDTATQGLGLGLPLCRRIAEQHGGSIMAESRPGKGARFTLSIPDRLIGKSGVSDVALDYTGGFNPTLVALADALPPHAFKLREQD